MANNPQKILRNKITRMISLGMPIPADAKELMFFDLHIQVNETGIRYKTKEWFTLEVLEWIQSQGWLRCQPKEFYKLVVNRPTPTARWFMANSQLINIPIKKYNNNFRNLNQPTKGN